MSLAKCPNSQIKKGKNDRTPFPESQHVGSKQKSNTDGSAFKQSLNPKRRIINKMVDRKKKEFVIPRKKKQAKELLQTHSFDSRETKELLRAVQVTLRDPNFWPSYKFERIEFVNNEKLARKYGDKKQSLRLESMRTNRELEDKFAFLYTTSRTEAKYICEHGLSTGHSSLTSLGDPNLGVYLCRFADIIYKRPLVNEDSGYILVFRVVKGKVRFIGGSNPELQPTPHHDCHVSKSLTTLSSKAQHFDVFESSQLYFYEIDENSEHFHVKQPRQLLPYAVLSFTIVNSDKQKTKPDDKLETKKTHIKGHVFPSSSEENNLCSPNRIEYKEDLISNANVSWSGILGINKKPLAYVDFLSYSRKKHLLPIHVDHINITWKVSHNDLRSVLRCPVFTNGKPASSGVCVELGNSKKFIYYEVRPVNQVKEKFNELVSHFVDTKMAGIIEYFDGAIYLYLIPTSSLTHSIGITDKKSPLALHALVQVRHAQRLLNTQVSNEDTNKEDVGIDDTSLNEAVIRNQVQEIFKKKFDSKLSHRKTKISEIASLMSKRIYVGDNVEGNIQERASDVKKKSSDVGSTLPSKGCSHKKKQIEYQRDAQKQVQHGFISATKEKNSSSEQPDSIRVPNTGNSRSNWSKEKVLDRGCSPEMQVVSFSDNKLGQKDEQNLSSSTSTAEKSFTDQQELASATKYSSKDKFDDTGGSDVTFMDSTTPFHSPLQNFKSEIDFSFVQKLIKEFQNLDKEKSALKRKRSFETVDQKLQGPSSLSAQDAHSDEAASYPYSVLPLSPPPIPPPPPPPLPPPPPPPVGPFFMPLSPPCVVVNKNNLNTISSEPSPAVLDATASVSLATSPVSPPTVKRQEMPIPGFEPPGSPAFQLMKEKVSFLNQSICTNATFFKDSNISNKSVATWNQLHSTSSVRYSPTRSTPFSSTESHTSLGNDRALHQEIPTGYRKSPQSMDISPKTNSTVAVVDKYHSKAEYTTANEFDNPDYNVVIKRPLTMAEKNSSQAIREIHKILFQNRDVLSTSSEDENNVRESPAFDHGSPHTVMSRTDRLEDYCIKPSLQKPGDENTCLMAQNSSNKAKEYTTEESEDEFYVSKDIGPVTEQMYPKEKDDKTDNKDVYNNQPFKKSLQDSLGTPNKQSLDSDSSSPITPELKSGLDLVNSLISGHKRGHLSSPLLKPETSHRIENDTRGSRDYGKESEECSRETTPRKEKFGESKKILSSRKRKVTIKRSDSSTHENKWEGVISEISDAEPSLDSVENLQNFERISPRRKLVILPGNIDTCEVSNQTAMGYRHDGGNHSDGVDDDWERDRKRRKLDEDQAKEMPEPLLQDHRSDSDSEMSISPLNSPTNFEYAVTNNDPTSRYCYVRTTPADGNSLEVTITRGCTDISDTITSNPDCHAPEPYHNYEHLEKPSSPTEIDIIPTSVIPDSPGTPETAIPSEDFLHANIRYWSLGYTEPVDRKAILPKKIDDMRFERIQEESEDATHRNERGSWSSPSSPYLGRSADHENNINYKREEPVVKKSRGEGCAQRMPKNIGEHSGYDLSYNDRNNIFYTMDHDDPHKTSSIDEPCTNDYKKLRDLDINTDRYPCHRYNDPRDSELYTSRSPYEDVVSPYSLESVDIEEPVDIVGPHGRYYSSDRVGAYNTHERHSSPLKIHASHYSPERMGTVNNYGRQRSLLDDDDSSRYLLEQSRAVEDKCEQQRSPLSDVEQATSSLLDQREAVDNNYELIRTFLDNNKQVLQYSLDQREDGNDEYDCQRSQLDNDIQTYRYSQDQTDVVNYEYEERRSSLDKNDRYSPHQRDEMSDEYGWETSLLNDEEASQYSLNQRGGIDDEYGWEISPDHDNQARQYSIDRREDTEYGCCRSPLDKDGEILYYSQNQRQSIHDDYHCQRQTLQRDGEAFQYSLERRASIDGEYECQGSPLNGSQTPQFSIVQGGEVHDEYGCQRSLLNDNEARYSPKRRQITGDVNTRESLSPLRISRHSQYSPSRKEEPDDVYRQRLSPDHSRDAEDVYSRRSCSPLQISSGMSLYSPYRRTVIDDYYETGKHDNEPIQSLPICKYRKKYLIDNKDFTVSDEEVIDPHSRGYLHVVNVHDNKEQQDNYSENQKSRDCDNVESNYSSKKDMLEYDSLRTPEYYEQHKYLEDVVEKNISKTTLELDRAVFDGIRDFPMQLMELEKYLQNVPRISEGKLLSDSVGAVPVVDRNTSFSRDPRLNKGCKAQDSLLTTERLFNYKSVLENVGSAEEQRNSVKGVKRNCVKAGVGSGGADGPGQEDRRKKKAGDHKKVIKPFPKKLSYFYVYNPDNDPECDAVKHYMIKTGAQFLDASNENNLKNLAGELRVLVRRKHRTSVHRISNLDKLKLCATVKFALFNTVEDVSKKTRAYAAIFQYGGVLIPDDVILRTVDPTYLEAMLRYIAEQNACHQKVFWVMNVRYIAYKKLGSQRPLTWRDAFVLNLLKKYRNEGFVNIINKDYVVENLSSIQRYLDTALKQQLELMPMYRHFIIISDLNKQTLEVSWFLNRGIGFMDVKEFLHLFAGEARMQHLFSASEYTKDACEQYRAEGTTQDIMQYDTIDSPEDEDSMSSIIPATSFISSSEILKASYEGDRDFYRSSAGNMVSSSANYKVVNMKEKRLEILSSINNVKTNLVDKMKAKGYCRKPMKDCGVIQGSISKQRQYERPKSDEPRLRVTPSKLDSHRCYDSTGTSDDSRLPNSKEMQYPRSLYNKRDSNHTNTTHSYKGALPSSKSNPRRERNSNQVKTNKNLGSLNSDNRKSPVHWHSALYIDNRAQ